MNSGRGSTNNKLKIWFAELGESVDAFFNPKQINIDKSIGWKDHADLNCDSPSLEFTSGHARSMSLELFFDTYETGEDVYRRYIAKLEKGTAVMEDQAGPLRRPPTCLIVWSSFPKFVGVIESLSVSYTMFFNNGTPCRATASLKLKEPPKSEAAQIKSAFETRTAFDREASLEAYMERRGALIGRAP